MSQTHETRHAGGAAGLESLSNCGEAFDSLTINPPEPILQAPSAGAVAAAIADLALECAVEAAHVANTSSRHFVENVEIGDLRAAEHSLGVAVPHLREAAKTFRE